MKNFDRRKFLKATGALTVGGLLPAKPTAARDTPDSAGFDDTIAVIYDATRCIGCRSCVRACQSANNLPAAQHQYKDVDFNMPEKLSENNWTVIQVCGKKNGAGPTDDWSFIKKNCMHCNEPACASACPVAALRKTKDGTVIYEESRCIGCRYCLLACPYHVPQYQWKDRMPRVRKCNWCRQCVDACPVGALVQGKRKDMIVEAHRRIDAEPGRYINRVYGENEAGGACQLILADMEHTKLGLPNLSSAARSSYADKIMKGLPGWIIGLGLFLGGLYRMEQHQRKPEDSTPVIHGKKEQ